MAQLIKGSINKIKGVNLITGQVLRLSSDKKRTKIIHKV